MLWHCDSSFKPTPANFRCCSARVIPGDGRQHRIRRHARRLGRARRGRPRRRCATWSASTARSTRAACWASPNSPRRSGAQSAPVPQRLVRRHPRHRAALAVPVGACRRDPRLAGAGGARPAARPDRARDAARIRLCACLAAADLVMWDNRGTMHRARRYDADPGARPAPPRSRTWRRPKLVRRRLRPRYLPGPAFGTRTLADGAASCGGNWRGSAPAIRPAAAGPAAGPSPPPPSDRPPAGRPPRRRSAVPPRPPRPGRRMAGAVATPSVTPTLSGQHLGQAAAAAERHAERGVAAARAAASAAGRRGRRGPAAVSARRPAPPSAARAPPAPRVTSAALAFSPSPAPITAPGGDGDDVLRRPPDLHADRVVPAIEPEARRRQQVAHPLPQRGVPAGDHRRGGQAGWPPHARNWGRTARRPACRAAPPRPFPAAAAACPAPPPWRRRPAAARAPAGRSSTARMCCAGTATRRPSAPCRRRRQIGGDREAGRQPRPGRCRAFSRAWPHRRRPRRIARPERHRQPRPRRLQRQRGAPGAGAEHGRSA